jgi:hypothetical protein
VSVTEAALKRSARKSLEISDLCFRVTISHGGKYMKGCILDILMANSVYSTDLPSKRKELIFCW